MTNIFKIDEPIRRSLYFVIAALISCAVIIEGQIISPYTEDLIGNNIVLINVIEISITLFFTYLYLVNDTKRIWDICGNKKLSFIIAGCACFVKLINDVLFFLQITDFTAAMVIFSCLILYYLIIQFLPKDCLTEFVENRIKMYTQTENVSDDSKGVEVSEDTAENEKPDELSISEDEMHDENE